MTNSEARELIRPGVDPATVKWADIGAGTGTFTRALMEVIEKGVVYAVDKNPHVLWNIRSTDSVQIKVLEGDFNKPLKLPQLDGILMANALHYTQDPEAVLINVIQYLKEGCTFILIEYESETPRPPWVPYPVPFERFAELCGKVGLNNPETIGTVPSQYGYEHIYAGRALKLKD